MKVSRILEEVAKSKLGQKFYKWCCEPGKDKFLNNTLPSIETVLSTGCYVWSTEKQKKIPREQKNLLQIQNIGSGVIGLGIGSAANHWISNQTDKIVKDLDPKVMDPKAIRKVSTGLRILAPVASTALVMRLLIPTALACFSGKVMDKHREKKERKLDINA